MSRAVTAPVVLILTHPDDLHADAVQVHLNSGGVEVYRLDTAGIGSESALIATAGRDGLSGRIGACPLDRVTCVWHRRPSEIPANDAADAAELRAGVGGVLAGLPHLNHPADMAAALKPYQLVTAARCGLNVPQTLITTDAAEQRAMAARMSVVVKPMSREIGRDAGMALVRVGNTSGWQRAIHMTQELITKRYDVRVTAVDGRLFAARIDSPHLDWRTDLTVCRHQVETVPTRMHAAVNRFMHKLRLRFGALDFAVDERYRWWFLEINPNGQWLWIEQETGLPIARAMASALSRRSRYAVAH